MSILVCRNGGVDIAGEALFREINFSIEQGEKVGLIGPNGAGKTTLIKACLGEYRWEEGECFLTGSVGYLPQVPVLHGQGTVYESMLNERADLLELQEELRRLESKMAEAHTDEKVFHQYSGLTERFEREGGYALEAQIRRILAGLGLDKEAGLSIGKLSGGQKTRLSLGKLLLRSPGMLILDEPTNHLDINATEWLEGFLSDYPGAVLIISHDRYFLDQIVQKILYLDQGKMKVYSGNYSEYELQKAVEQKTLEREAEKTAKKIARLEEYVRRNKAGVNARQARGREIQLNKLKPVHASAGSRQVSLSFGTAARSGDRVLEIEDMALSFGQQTIFRHVDLDLRRGDKVALLGKNGAGKTSLFKIIMGRLSGQGKVRIGANVKIGYYSQEHEELDLSSTVIDEIRGSSDLYDPAIRSLLARFGFRGEEVFKPVRSLSGGEKSRLALCKLFLSDGNLLLLDEPTNHLDGETRAELEDILLEYEGTVLLISHDRYFIDRVANKVAELNPSGLNLYQGSYFDYREQIKEMGQEKEEKQITQAQKERSQSKDTARQKKRLQQMETEISNLEQQLLELEKEMEANSHDYEKAMGLHKRYEEMKSELDSLMETWAEMIDE